MSKRWTFDGKVSIVIPCFNHGEMLRETLESVERFRNSNLAEVIIVDDGSTDPYTCAYFQELSNSSYKIIHQANRGLGPARNTGVLIAQSEYILPLDSDNRLREPYLNRGVEVLNNDPSVAVVYGDAEYFGEKRGRWHIQDFDLNRLVRQNYIDSCALYRKCIWEAVRGYDEEMPTMGWEDWDFWMRVAVTGWRFVHLDEIAFDYRVRNGSMIENTNVHSLELIRYIFEKGQNQAVRIIREQQEEIEHLTAARQRIIESVDYRIGSSLIGKARKVKRMFSRNKK